MLLGEVSVPRPRRVKDIYGEVLSNGLQQFYFRISPSSV